MDDIILLAFSPGEEADFLLGVDEEIREIQLSLTQVPVEAKVFPTLRIEDLLQSFIDHPGNIRILHYGGHANAYQWLLQEAAQQPVVIEIGSLAQFLRKQQLELVLLNGCATAEQAAELLQADVKCVIATSQLIPDDAARQFATYFYKSLVGGASISEAFERASDAMQVVSSSGTTRSFSWESQPTDEQSIPWQLFPASGSNWKLPPTRLRQEPQWLTPIPQFNSEHFIGREKELAAIRRAVLIHQKPILIQGVGGIGKSALIKTYVDRFRFRYNHIIWIETPSEGNTTEILAVTTPLHTKLGLHFDKKEIAATKALETLRATSMLSGKTLVIIDNASPDIESILTQLSFPTHFHLILTSRNQLAPCHTLAIHSLPLPQARALFCELYPLGSQSPHEVNQLLDHIGLHTLTIELVAKTLSANRQLTLLDMLQKLQQDELNQQQVNRNIWTAHSAQYVTIYQYLLSVFELSTLDKIERDLLLHFSVLPDFPINGSRLLEFLQVVQRYPMLDSFGKQFKKWVSQQIGFSKAQSVDVFALYDEALNNLTRKGWLTYQKQDQSFLCHPMIQYVLRHQLKPRYNTCSHLVVSINNILSLESTQPEESWDEVIADFEWIPYGESLITHLTASHLFEYKAKSILCISLGFMQYMNGNYTRARELLKEGIEIPKSYPKLSAQLDPNIKLTQCEMLAQVYAATGQYKEASETQTQAIEQLPNWQYAPHFWYRGMLKLHYYCGLAGNYEKQKQIIQQLEPFQQEAGKLLFGDQVDKMNQLKEQGQFGEAFDISKNWISQITVAMNEMDSDDLSYFTSIYLQSGLYEEAYEMVRSNLDEALTRLDQLHPLIAFKRFLLARITLFRGEHEEAETLLEDILASFQHHFGNTHPNTISSRSFLSSIYYTNGAYTKSLREIQLVHQTLTDKQERNRDLLINCQIGLSKNYDAQGKLTEALHYAEEALRLAREQYNAAHHMVFNAGYNLAEILNNQQAYTQSLTHLADLYQLLNQHLPHDHRLPMLATTLIHLYLQTHNEAAAQPLINQYLAQIKEQINQLYARGQQKNIETLTRELLLGRLLLYNRDFDEAITILESLLIKFPRRHQDKPLYPTIQTYLGEAYLKADQLDKAHKILASAQMNFKQNVGPYHPFTRRCERIISQL